MVLFTCNILLNSMSFSNGNSSFLQTLIRRVNAVESSIQELHGELRSIKRLLSSNSSDSDGSLDIDKCKKPRYDFTEENGYAVVYTDGACENNGKANAKAGIGVWFGKDHPLNVSEPVTGRATNNTAEIQACVSAVKLAHANGIRKLKIKTDSQFVINSMTQWIHRWKKNNWKVASGGDVKNKEDFIILDNARCQLENLIWEHVDGHKGIVGNEEADRLARNGALRYKPV